MSELGFHHLPLFGATWNLGMWLKPLGPLIVAQILEADFQHGKLPCLDIRFFIQVSHNCLTLIIEASVNVAVSLHLLNCKMGIRKPNYKVIKTW